jgi:hypothetical protein
MGDEPPLSARLASAGVVRLASASGFSLLPAPKGAFGLPVAVGLAVALCAGGCVKVAPYEREHLAKPSMDFARETRETGFRSHVHESREGATGGYGAAGGGCGCN